MIRFDLLIAGMSFNQPRPSAGLSQFQINPLVIAGIVLIALFWGVLYFWDRITGSLKTPAVAGNDLFNELCVAHQISRAEKATLKQIASQSGLKEPATLFVEPAWIDKISASNSELKTASQNLKFKLFE